MPPRKSARDTAEELLDLIERRAPGLIAAGITHIAIGELSATLSSRPPVAPVAPKDKAAAQDKPAPPKKHIDPLRDASTYAGGRVPGFTREEDRTFE